MTSGSNLSEAFVRQFERKGFRDAFVEDQLSSRLSKMIRSLREQRGWTQAELAKRMGTKQSVISRIENADYGKLSVKSLLEVAAAFELPLFIDMPEWRDWFGKIRDFSATSFHRQSFNVDAIIFSRVSADTRVSKATASGKPLRSYTSERVPTRPEIDVELSPPAYVISAESEGNRRHG